MIGILFYGYKLNKQPYTEEEKDFLTSLANLSANSIENALRVEEIQKFNSLFASTGHVLWKTLLRKRGRRD